MLARKIHVARFIVVAFVFIAPRLFAATKLEPLTIGYSTFAGSFAPLWAAVEERLGAKYGLDLRAIYAGRVRPQQLLTSGDVPFVLATGTGAMTSHIVGIKDQVMVATITNKVGSAIFSRQNIKSVEELKGKLVATGRPGAFQDVMTRYVLLSRFGLVPDRDVKFMPTGEPALAIQALEHGVVDAAGMSVPYLFVARKMGFRELANYDKLGITYPYTAVTVLRPMLTKQPELIEKILKCLIEGTHLIKTDKQRALAILRKYQRGSSEEILEETYQHTAATLDDAPHPTLAVFKNALEMLTPQFPQAKQADVNLMVDGSFMKKIDDSRFIRGLYKK
jgi:ABC-type nitrate/sulfonate/bicarbonate transport system substrate-binding protein